MYQESISALVETVLTYLYPPVEEGYASGGRVVTVRSASARSARRARTAPVARQRLTGAAVKSSGLRLSGARTRQSGPRVIRSSSQSKVRSVTPPRARTTPSPVKTPRPSSGMRHVHSLPALGVAPPRRR